MATHCEHCENDTGWFDQGEWFDGDGHQCQICGKWSIAHCDGVQAEIRVDHSHEFDEGDICPECSDTREAHEKARLIFAPVENCSCHISPPCDACVETPLICPNCHSYPADPEET